MSKNRNYHKKPVVAKDRFVGVRLDKEVFSKVEDAAMAAGLSISEYIRRTLTHRKITIKEEIVVEVPVIKELIAALTQCAKERGFGHLPLYFEPGRSLVAQTGMLLMRVEYLKPTAAKNFCIVDAAMTDMIRPTLYQAQMRLVNCIERSEGAALEYDVVGPVCESGDFLAKNRTLAVCEDDILAMTGAGAYGMSMASNYNARSRAAEVLIDADKAWLIRRRETIEDQMALESRLPQV